MRVEGVFLSCLAIYFFFAAGYIDTVDATPSIETAEAIATQGTLAIEPQDPRGDLYRRAAGRRDRWYSKMGLAYPFLYVPAVAVGNLAPAYLRRHAVNFAVSLVNPVLTALLIALLFLFYRRHGWGAREATALAAVAAFATLLFPYSKSCHRETLQALCLTGVLVMADRRAYALSGAFGAVGCLTKLGFIVPLLPAMAYAVFLASRDDSPRRKVLALISPLAIAGFIWGGFAYQAWGDPLSTGYSPAVNRFEGGPWSRPFWSGIYGQWLSMDTGLIFFCPVVLLVLGCLRFEPLSLVVVLVVAFQTAFYAKWTAQGQAYGPRFLVVTLPVMLLLWKDLQWKRWKMAVVAVSLAVQLTASTVKIQQYWTMRGRSCARLTDPHWLANFKLLAHKVKRQPEIYRTESFGGKPCGDIDLTDAESLAGLNFWWLHLARVN